MKRHVQIAIVPISPALIKGRHFNLDNTSLQDVLKFLEQDQPFQVIVYQGTFREEISGANNKEKSKNLKKYLSTLR
jgi:hypothetical protein